MVISTGTSGPDNGYEQACPPEHAWVRRAVGALTKHGVRARRIAASPVAGRQRGAEGVIAGLALDAARGLRPAFVAPRPQGDGCDAGAFEVAAPAIVAGPAATTTDASPAFAFSSEQPGTAFECRLDGPGGAGSWETCVSPKTYAGLGRGDYVFSVRAVGASAQADRAFTVLAPVGLPPAAAADRSPPQPPHHSQHRRPSTAAASSSSRPGERQGPPAGRAAVRRTRQRSTGCRSARASTCARAASGCTPWRVRAPAPGRLVLRRRVPRRAARLGDRVAVARAAAALRIARRAAPRRTRRSARPASAGSGAAARAGSARAAATARRPCAARPGSSRTAAGPRRPASCAARSGSATSRCAGRSCCGAVTVTSRAGAERQSTAGESVVAAPRHGRGLRREIGPA